MRRDKVASPAIFTWVLTLTAPLAVSGMLVWSAAHMRRPDVIESSSHIHLPTGVIDGRDGVAFSLDATADPKRLVIRTQNLTPRSPSGESVEALESSQTLLIGRYFYSFSYSGGNLRWELSGARLKVNEIVGRNPAFERTSTLAYEPKGESGGELALWLDGMPSRAFTTRPASECRSAAEVCLEMHEVSNRVTLERGTVPRGFHHTQPGEKVAVGPSDRLWIANFPYRLKALPGGSELDLLLAENAGTVRGARAGLGAPGLNGVAAPDLTGGFVVEDVTAQFREHHLSTRRWDPEAEDEMQRLVDSGLLCLSYTRENDRIVPRIDWTDLAAGECRDPLGLAAPEHAGNLNRRLLERYILRRRNNQLIREANEQLKRLPEASPRDIPFVFEWWPVATPAGRVQLPLRIWGVRTGSTYRSLVTESKEAADRDDLAGAVALQSRGGGETVLARDGPHGRVYASGAQLLGLGPLLGIRQAVDGLDEAPPPSERDKRVTLTIDPDLQRALWTTLKTTLGSIGTRPRTFEQSPYFGISGVVLDAETGDVLSVLNWPSALVWEDPERLASLAEGGSWGVPRPSLNGAMMRADKVGSVFKILAMYAMTDAGVLDGRNAARRMPSCDRLPFGAFLTRNGRVETIATPFEDAQAGPLPVGRQGLEAGLDQATATSCNTYFALAATLLLDGNPPELVQVRSCPIDERMRRTDMGKPTSRQWLLCSSLPASARSRGRTADGAHWLLLPEGEDLGARSRRAFADPARSAGYFARALKVGFRLGYTDSRGRLLGRGARAYEGAPFRSDWMFGMPRAEGRVFEYPTIFSPLSYFGGGTETWDAGPREVPGGVLRWRDFAAQAIGEAGQGSALSVAAMYSAVGREDGSIVAPRLTRGAEPSATRIFDPQGQRTARIREALRQPLNAPNGTARQLGAYLKANGIENVVGKTGTFTIDYRRPEEDRTEDGGAAKPGCAIPTLQSLISGSPPAASLLGSSYCEAPGWIITGVHRYPEDAPANTTPVAGDSGTGQLSHETHTTFAAVMLPSRPGGHAMVAALIADLDEYSGERIKARDVIGPLLKEISAWMR